MAVSRCTKGCKWPGLAGHGGLSEDGTIIEMGLVLLWNQDLRNGWQQSARQKIECMQGGKEFRGREGRRVRMNK